MKMPFGKFKGQEIEDLPDSYLCWLYNLDWAHHKWVSAPVAAEFYRRFGRVENGAKASPWVDEIIAAGFRALARQHHPDVGGSADAMREILDARAWLLEVINRGGE